MKFDLITIGDTTIDTFLFIHDATVNCALKKDVCQLCVNYADKLPVKKMTRLVAGNAANNAVGSRRLGMKTAIVTTLGDDGSGEWIHTKLRAEKVDTKFLTLDKKTDTNASTVLSFHGERTIFVYHAPRKYGLPARLPAAKVIYYTSVGEHHAKLNQEVVAYIKRTKARLAFNPGTYQLRSGLKALAPVIAVCDTLFVNKEEAMRIVGPHDDVRHYLMALHKLGVQVVAVTDGPNGAFVFDGRKFFKIGIPKTKVVERTGAGDAFATGFMAARFYGRGVSEAMCWGTMNSSSVIMFVGPQAGLLTRAGLEKFHKKIKHTCATEF